MERRQQRQQIIALSIELERLTSQLAAERIKSEQVSRAKDARILVTTKGESPECDGSWQSLLLFS